MVIQTARSPAEPACQNQNTARGKFILFLLQKHSERFSNRNIFWSLGI